MQHTLTPFLIRALSKTEGWGGKEERQKERKGAALCLRVGEKKEGTLVALISWQVCTGPALHGKAMVASGSVKLSRKEET